MNTLIQPEAVLSQRDPRWASTRLGFGMQTIGRYGCAIASLAMLVNALEMHRPPIRPNEVNELLKRFDAFGGPWRNYVSWPNVPKAFFMLKWLGRVDCPDRPAPLDQIDALLERSLPVIVYVDLSMVEAGLQQHFVVVAGKTSENYVIADPWHGDVGMLCPRYGRTPAVAVCGFVMFDRAE